MVPLFIASAARHFCCRAVFFFLASLTPCGAAVLVIDTFDEGPFHETNDQSAPRIFYQHGSMLGGRRLVSISTHRRTTVVSSSIVTGTSALEFDTGNGLWDNGISTGRITLTWSVNEAVELLGYDAFRFSFSMLTGQGRVNVAVDKSGGGSGDTTVPLWNSGELLVPFADVDFGSEDISSGSYFQVSISGVSKDFAFSLDEISIVPEPGVGFLLGAAGWMLQGRRRRSGGTLAG
ncbi:MAG: PEP-CTERM sorting domain-containing protein [Verrucomicrobiota bacterium]